MRHWTLGILAMLLLATVAEVNGAILIFPSPESNDSYPYRRANWNNQYDYGSIYDLYDFAQADLSVSAEVEANTPQMVCESAIGLQTNDATIITSVCATGQALGIQPEWLDLAEQGSSEMSLSSIAAFHHVMPEPATLAIWSLIGLALAGAGAWRRRSGSADWTEGSRRPARPSARPQWSNENREAILDIIDRGYCK